jgi:hypothetical protein
VVPGVLAFLAAAVWLITLAPANRRVSQPFVTAG